FQLAGNRPARQSEPRPLIAWFLRPLLAEEVSDHNSQHIQSHHRNGHHHHVWNVGRGRNHGSDDERNKDRVSGVDKQERPADKTNARENKNDGRYFEDDREAKFDHDEQIEILARIDQYVPTHVLFPLEQELESERERDKIAEQSAENEEQRREENEGQRVFPLVPVKSRRNEEPYLTQHERRCQKNPGHQSQFEFEIEAFGGRREDERRNPRFSDRHRDSSEQGIGKRPAHAEADTNGNQGMDEALAQFLEVVEERHLAL